MANVYDVFKQLEREQQIQLFAEEETIVIDAEQRTIVIPESESLFGVKFDKDVERKYFQCPKIVGDNIDLSQCQIYIAYVAMITQNQQYPETGVGLYNCDDVEISGDNITFSWKLSGNVFAQEGYIAFKVVAKQSIGGELSTRWNTVPAFGTILNTISDGEDIAEQYPDIINQLLTKMESVEQIATPEAMQGYVDAYLKENPVTGGMTEEQKKQLIQNTFEIQDIRVGHDGTQYDTAGEAVRDQVGSIYNDLFDYKKKNKKIEVGYPILIKNALKGKLINAEFVPYFPDIKNINISVYGKSLLEFKIDEPENGKNGVTAKKDDNGVILLAGTATSNIITLITTNTTLLPKGKYYISGCMTGSSTTYRINVYKDNSVIAQSINGSGTFVLDDASQIRCVLYINNGSNVDNVFIAPMISCCLCGFEDYKEPKTISYDTDTGYQNNIELFEGYNTILISEICYSTIEYFNNGHKEYSSISVDDNIRNNIADVATTYINLENITYGDSTAWSKVLEQDDQGRYYIDCSAYVGLILMGIPFKNSKYNGLSKNIMTYKGYNNINLYNWFSTPNPIDKTKTMFASQHLAEYLYNLGYAFIPSEDFSNIDTGDILFYCNDYSLIKENRFMNITHSGIFGRKYPDGRIMIFNVIGGFESGGEPYVTRTTIDSISQQVVLAARLPNRLGESNRLNIFEIANPNIQENKYEFTFDAPLSKYHHYTLYIELEYSSQNDYIIVKDAINKTIHYKTLMSESIDTTHLIIPVWLNDTNDGTLFNIEFYADNILQCKLNKICVYDGIKTGGF